jgi:hypothetical protein
MPLRVAASLTNRVETKETSRENANNPKNRRVKVSVPSSPEAHSLTPSHWSYGLATNPNQTKSPLGLARVMNVVW